MTPPPPDESGSTPTLDEGSIAPMLVSASDEPVPRPPDDARWERRGALGWGGMGRVTLAFDRVLGREVALKEPTSEVDERLFLRECLITARLEHPGIVPIYEVGRSLGGRPWFAMRVVRGRSLAAILAEHPDAAERLRLLRHLRAAAEAVASAHAVGIVHRDLKPANVMIGAFGETQVIDWGLASARGLADETLGGTPSAMSPEQARGEPQGPASDVWSLGVILWQLVAGRSPLAGLERGPLMHAVERGQLPDLRDAAPGAPDELLAIARRALAVAPADRYPDAAALADDLGRFIDGGLVRAHGYSPWALLGRLVRAWRVPLIVGGVAAVVIAVLLALGFAKVNDERRRSEANLALSLVASARQALSLDARGEAEVLAAHALARAELPEGRGILAALPSPRPGRELLAALPCSPMDVVEEGGGTVLCRRDDTLMVVEHQRVRWSLPVPGLRSAAFYGRGGGVAVLGPRGVVRLDAANGAALGPLVETACGRRFRTSPRHETAFLNGASCVTHVDRQGIRTETDLCAPTDMAAHAVAPDASHHITLCKDGALRVREMAPSDNGDSALEHRAPANVRWSEVYTLALTAGGEVLFGTNQGDVFRAPLGAEQAELVARGQGLILALEVAPSGRLAAFTWEVGAPLIMDLESMASLGRVAGPDTRLASFIDDTHLLAAGEDLTRLDYGAVRPRAHHFDAGIAALAVSPDGQRLAVASGDAITVVATDSRRRLGTARWGGGFVKTMAFLPGGSELVGHALKTRDLRVVTADGETPVAVRGARLDAILWRAMVALPDGTLVGAAYSQGLFRVRPAPSPSGTTGDTLERIDPVPMEYLVADGDRVGALGVDQLPRLGSGLGADGRLLVCDSETVARAIAIDAGAPGLVVALPHGLELRCPRDDLRYAVLGSEAMFVAAGSGYLAAGARDGSVWLWRRGDTTPLAVFRHHAARVEAMAFDPRGRWLAAGGWDGDVAFFDLPSGSATWGPIDPGAVEAAWGLELGRILGILGTRPPKR